MSLYVAAYDVSADWARDRVAQVLIEYGQRLQRSVFMVWVEPEELPELRQALGALLSKTDRFDLLPVDNAPQRSRWSWQRPIDEFSSVILA